MDTPIFNDGTDKYECAYCGQYADEDKKKVNAHSINCPVRADRPAAPDSPALSEPDPVETASEETDLQERIRRIREKREGSDYNVQKLSHAPFPDDGYHYHIFNDNWRKDPNRIRNMQAKGYEVVGDEADLHRGVNEDGSSISGIVMRIPQAIYDEDQKAKQGEVDKVDEAIGEGSLAQEPGDNRYIPDGIRIHSDNREPSI